jgi:transcriptional regulator with XRE-family HTH domain
MSESVKIGERLRAFGKERFGSMSNFARAMGMRPQTLNNYLSGQLPIGPTIREKFRNLGGNILWLMTGVKGEEQTRLCTPEEEAMLKRLMEIGIDTKEKLNQYLSPENLAADMALVLRERMAHYNVKRRKK